MKTPTPSYGAAGALLLAGALAVTALALGGGSLTAKSQPQAEEEIARDVREFWDAALATDFGADEALTHKYLSRATRDFVRKCNSSLPPEEVGPPERPPGAAPGVPVVSTRGLSLNVIDYEWSYLNLWAHLLYERQPELQRITVVRHEGDEALVSLHYDTKGRPYDGQYILLRKEQTGWKIFMATVGIYLDEYCPSFAKSQN